MNYEIDADGVLWISQDGADVPFLKQPHWPNGEAWKKGEAKKWGEQFILAANDPTAELPGDSPDEPTKPRPEIETPKLTEG
jgi:hypothetical protein